MNETSVELARIRLVTRHYDELQGLRKCSIGVGMLAGAWTATWAPPTFFGSLIPAVVMIGPVLAGQLWCDNYYAQRFGRVRQNRSEAVEAGKWRGVLFGIALGIAMQLDVRSAGRGVPSLVFVTLAVFPAWQLVRDWPHRKFLLIDISAAAAASALHMNARPVGSIDEWLLGHYWIGFALLGVASLVTGRLDHQLLAGTLHGRGDSLEQPEHVDTL